MASISTESMKNIVANIDLSGIQIEFIETAGGWQNWILNIPNSLQSVSLGDIESVYEAMFEKADLELGIEGCKDRGKCHAVTKTPLTEEGVKQKIMIVIDEIKNMPQNELEEFTDRVNATKKGRDDIDEGLGSIDVSNISIADSSLSLPPLNITVERGFFRS